MTALFLDTLIYLLTKAASFALGDNFVVVSRMLALCGNMVAWQASKPFFLRPNVYQ